LLSHLLSRNPISTPTTCPVLINKHEERYENKSGTPEGIEDTGPTHAVFAIPVCSCAPDSEAFFVKGPTQSAPVLMGVLNDLLGKKKFLTGVGAQH
jgi:hypothetical protein